MSSSIPTDIASAPTGNGRYHIFAEIGLPSQVRRVVPLSLEPLLGSNPPEFIVVGGRDDVKPQEFVIRRVPVLPGVVWSITAAVGEVGFILESSKDCPHGLFARQTGIIIPTRNQMWTTEEDSMGNVDIFQDLDDARLYWKMEHTEEPPIPVTLGGKSIIVGFNFVKVE